MTAENQGTGKAGEVGRLLRAAREESRQNLKDVAERLRIRHQFLEAIEDGRYQDLPGAAYATGFVRAYAEYLGLDGLEVARRFKEEGALSKMGTDLSFPIPSAESGLPSRGLLVAGVALMAAVYGVWHFIGSPDKPLADVVQDIPDRIAALMKSSPDADPAAKREPEALPTTETPPSGSEQTAAVPVAPAAAPVPPPQAATPASELAQGQNAQEPIAAENMDIQPPDDDHDDASAEQAGEASQPAPLPAPTAALPSVPAMPSVPAGTPVTEATPHPAAQPPAAKPPASAPASAPATAPTQAQGTPAPAKPTVTAQAPAAPAPVAQAPTAPATAPKAPPSTPLAALPSQPAAAEPTPPATRTDATRPDTTRVEPATAPVERQGSEPAVPESSSAPGRIFGDENTGARVVLKARADTWIQVRNGDGMLTSRLLRKGDSYMVPDQKGLELMTGNAGGLDIVVDGKTLPSLGKTGEVRRGIPLQADALKSAP